MRNYDEVIGKWVLVDGVHFGYCRSIEKRVDSFGNLVFRVQLCNRTTRHESFPKLKAWRDPDWVEVQSLQTAVRRRGNTCANGVV